MSGLVIMRKRGEKVFIGDNIAITAIECRDGSVRLHIDAPRDMPIVREEIVDDTALREKRKVAVRNLEEELLRARQKLAAVTCPGNEQIADLGRRDAYPVGEGCENG